MTPALSAVSLLEQIARSVYSQRGQHDLHPGQWAVLRFLARAEPGANTIGNVANHLGVVHSTASRAVASLARKGLLNIRHCGTNGRQLWLEITVTGRRMLAFDPINRLSTAMAALHPDLLRELALDLEKIGTKLAERNE